TELAERRRRIEDHGRMLRERVQEITQQRSERSAEIRLLEGVEAFCPSIREAMEEPSFTVQQKVLQLVVNRIVVEDNQVIIEHVVPTGPVRLQTEQQTPRAPCCSSLKNCSPRKHRNIGEPGAEHALLLSVNQVGIRLRRDS